MLVHIGQNLTHHIKLVVPGKEQRLFLPSGLLVLFLDQLGEMLDDVGQAAAGQHVLPQVRGFVAILVDRIALAVLLTLVEGQEVGALA